MNRTLANRTSSGDLSLPQLEFKAEAQKRNWEVEPVSGQELEAIAKKVVVQPPDVIERMKKVLAQ